jgi:hypothetical protein
MTRAAAVQVALLFPALLFLGSVLVAKGGPPQYDLGHFAEQIVQWYAARMWTLFLLLLALPFGVLVTGWLTLFATPGLEAKRPSLASIVVSWATLTSAGVMGIVGLHVLAN